MTAAPQGGGALLRQVDATSCGAAAILMARAATDRDYAAAVDAARADVPDLVERLQHHVRRRTAAGALGPAPWPRALGTPPWTAARELSRVFGVPYRHAPVRGTLGPRLGRPLAEELDAVHAAAQGTGRGGTGGTGGAGIPARPLPSLLYTGHTLRDLVARGPWPTPDAPGGRAAAAVLARVPRGLLVPRHVLAVLPVRESSAPGRRPGAGEPSLDLYEPGSGRVLILPLGALAGSGSVDGATEARVRSAFGGWTHLTWVVRPT